MVGTAICLSFQASAEGASSVMVVEEGSYVTGAEGYTLEARTVVEVGGHNWSQWKVIKAATCTEAGEESRTCLNCGEVEKRTVPATGHQWGEWAVTKAATCTEAGEETRTCTLCGEKETRAIAATGAAPKPGRPQRHHTDSGPCPEAPGVPGPKRPSVPPGASWPPGRPGKSLPAAGLPSHTVRQ